MNRFDMNLMKKQVEAMHRLKAEAAAVEHISESFDALEAEIGEVAELLEELGDDEENDEIDEEDDYDCGDCCECCQCPFRAIMDASDGEIHFFEMR